MEQWQSTADEQASPWQDTSDHQEPKTLGDHIQSFLDQTAALHPVRTAQGMAQMVEHPGLAANSYADQNTQLLQKAKDAWKRGDHVEAAAHAVYYLLNGIPGLGARLDTAGEKAAHGDYGGSAADTASAAVDYVVAPKVAGAVTDAATEPGALAKPARATVAAAKAGGKDVAVGAAKVAAGSALKSSGVLGDLGDSIGAYELAKSGAKQMGRGAKAGFAAGKAAWQSTAEEGAVAAKAPTEAAPSILEEPKQLGAGAIITEPPADTSGVIKGWQPTILENETKPVETAAPEPEHPPALLDDITKGLGGKSFSDLSADGQNTVRGIADRLNGKPQAPSPPPPGPLPGPIDIGEPQKSLAPKEPPKPEPAALPEIQRVPVKGSSNIESVGYDPEAQTLHVEYKGGRIYEFPNFTPAQHEAFMKAESKGKHFAREIKPLYETTGQQAKAEVPMKTDPPETSKTPAAASVVSGDFLTKQQMIDRGADGHLSRALEMEVPIDKLDGLEPVPASDEPGGQYTPGRAVTQPIEVTYDKAQDAYMVSAGNHRIAQAKANGQSTIRAFVETPPVEAQRQAAKLRVDAKRSAEPSSPLEQKLQNSIKLVKAKKPVARSSAKKLGDQLLGR